MQTINYENLFSHIAEKFPTIENSGEVANYIPELQHVDEEKYAIHLLTNDNQSYSYGDVEDKFSIQSIAKVFSLSLAFKVDNSLLKGRLGVEPSGNAFNALSLLEHENGIPRNPFINAGALVVCDLLISKLPNPKEELLSFIQELSGNNTINYCPRIAQSEKAHGFRNAAHVNLMKSFGNINNDVDDVLDLYFHLCSIEMSVKDLAQSFQYLVNDGINPLNNKRVITESKSKRINAIMLTCGFYDEAGEFAFRVGLAGKSGVGGGIVAIHPDNYSISVWSPKLNAKGNSYRGMRILEFITTHTGSSIF